MNAGGLRNKIDVYAKEKIINTIGQADFEYKLLKSVWAEIKMNNTGNREKENAGNTTFAQTSFKISLRKSAIPNLSRDMYFMYQNQRYDIEYFIPHFKNKDIIEVYCELVME